MPELDPRVNGVAKVLGLGFLLGGWRSLDALLVLGVMPRAIVRVSTEAMSLPLGASLSTFGFCLFVVVVLALGLVLGLEGHIARMNPWDVITDHVL